MKHLAILALGTLAFAATAQETTEIARQDGQPTEDVVVVCPITGVIEPGVQVVVERAVKEAKVLNAKAIIFRVDTPGGRVDSAVEIAKAIGEAPCRTIAFIEGMGAISAGALISFACDDLIMTPESNIGAATPVIATPQGMQPTGEKEVSFMRAKMRALAEANGHNPDIAQAMVDKNLELRAYRDADGKYVVYSVTPGVPVTGEQSGGEAPAPQDKSPLDEIIESLTGTPLDKPEEQTEQPSIQGPQSAPEPGTVIHPEGSEVILPSGMLLTMTANEAIEYGVIPATAKDLNSVVAQYGLEPANYLIVEANWAERTFRFLTNPTVAGLLLLLAMGGLYFEVKTPGFGIPGIIGVTALALLFGSHYILGIADVVDIVLILAGVALIAVEVFIIPGFGLAGVAGSIMLLLGLYLSLVNFTVPQYSWDFQRLNEVLYSFVVALVLFVPTVFLSWKVLSKTPMYGALVLAGGQRVEDGYVAQSEDDVRAALGKEGTAASMLRPVGRGRFGDKNLMVVARGDFIEPGAPIRIVEVAGNRYVVEKIEGESSSA